MTRQAITTALALLAALLLWSLVTLLIASPLLQP
jgi:hypothetical protein